MDFEELRTTVLPFVYEAKDWPKSPRTYLQEYTLRKGLSYCIFYVRDNAMFDAIHMTLILDNEIYEASQHFYKLDIAEHNIIILTLINIYGYCDSASELQKRIHTYNFPHKNRKNRRPSARSEPMKINSI